MAPFLFRGSESIGHVTSSERMISCPEMKKQARMARGARSAQKAYAMASSPQRAASCLITPPPTSPHALQTAARGVRASARGTHQKGAPPYRGASHRLLSARRQDLLSPLQVPPPVMTRLSEGTSLNTARDGCHALPRSCLKRA